eukprot:3402450-Rhodomonas_salina.3
MCGALSNDRVSDEEVLDRQHHSAVQGLLYGALPSHSLCDAQHLHLPCALTTLMRRTTLMSALRCTALTSAMCDAHARDSLLSTSPMRSAHN